MKNQVAKERSKDCTNCGGKAEETKVCSPILPEKDSLPQQVDNSNFVNVAKSRSCEDLSSDISGKQLPFVDKSNTSSVRRSQIFYSSVSARGNLESKGHLDVGLTRDVSPVACTFEAPRIKCSSVPGGYWGGACSSCVDEPNSVQRLEDLNDCDGADSIPSSASTGEYRRSTLAIPSVLKKDGKRWLLIDARGVVRKKGVSGQSSGVLDAQQKVEKPSGERVFFMHEEKGRFVTGCYMPYILSPEVTQPRLEFFLSHFFGE